MLNGIWILASSPLMIRYLCTLGKLDILLFDQEHSKFSYSQLAACIDIARAHNKKTCIRISSHTKEEILHSIELNPDILMVPAVSTQEDIDKILTSFYLPNRGSRGFSPYTYSSVFENNSMFSPTKLCLQIEDKMAIEDLSIFKHNSGIDSIFIGRYDLSRSLEVEIDDPLFLQKLCLIADELRNSRIKVGTVCISNKEHQMLSIHFDFLSKGSDITRMLESERVFDIS